MGLVANDRTRVVDSWLTMTVGSRQVWASNEISKEPIQTNGDFAVYKSQAGFIYTYKNVTILNSICHHKKLLKALKWKKPEIMGKEYFFMYFEARRNKTKFKSLFE